MTTIHIPRKEWDSLQVAKCEAREWKVAFGTSINLAARMMTERDASRLQGDDLKRTIDMVIENHKETLRELDFLQRRKPDPVPGYRSALTRARNVSDLIIGSVIGTVAGAGLMFLFMRHFS